MKGSVNPFLDASMKDFLSFSKPNISLVERGATLMRTSWALGGATSMSSMEKGLWVSHSTAALHLITWKMKGDCS